MDSRKTQHDGAVPAHSGLPAMQKLGIASFAGLAELCVFYGLADTPRKRLQKTPEPVILKDKPLAATLRNAVRIVLGDAYNKNGFAQVQSLYRGFPLAMGYKVVQRTFQLGGQPIIKNALDDVMGAWVKERMSDSTGKTILSTLAGMGVGLAELLLLPVENAKIKAQTLGTPLSMWNTFQAEGRYLFKGVNITVLRNVPGAGLLFGVSAAVSYGVFGLEDPRQGNLSQRAISSTAGVASSIVATNPFEVVRTRVLASSGRVSAMSIFTNTVKNEGWGALLFKGLVPGLVFSGPKLLFSMMFVQWLQNQLEDSSVPSLPRPGSRVRD